MDSNAEVAMLSLVCSIASRAVGVSDNELEFVSPLFLPQSQSIETSKAFAIAQSDSALGIVFAFRYSEIETCLIPDNSDNAF